MWECRGLELGIFSRNSRDFSGSVLECPGLELGIFFQEFAGFFQEFIEIFKGIIWNLLGFLREYAGIHWNLRDFYGSTTANSHRLLEIAGNSYILVKIPDNSQ